MSFVDVWNKAKFDEFYSMGAESGGHPSSTVRAEIRLNYHKFAIMPGRIELATGLINAFGWDINQKLCILGSVFGWLSEAVTTPLTLRNIYET